ncbi:uncharacterized protein LOC128965383 isoform X2 [Oppia nitens]|uniref:uncharacterized protein LOC128965383 isoform X2 n=1 Tax=Oppia nitens TaxID=1686743 RepID=UPI0023DB4C44|nr:uncharacterized protein LOC128965383 isoform X2 [Oppia nitens]
MDLMKFNANNDFPIEKKQKVNKLLKDKNLFENNNNRDIFYTDDESQDLLIHKCSSLNFESVDKHSKAVTFVAKEFNDSVDTDSEKWYSKKVNDLLDLWSHKAKHIINSSAIHELYIQYLNQSQLQKDLTKTDYTYAKSISYNKNISNTSNLFDWLVPNMSRKSISSSVKTSTQLSRTLSTHTKTEIINNSINSSNLMLSNTERESSVSPDKRSPNDQMFTRSHCLGGNQCEAGCEVHKKARRRYNKSGEILIPNSGQGLEPMEPEIEFSDDDDYAMNNRRNQQLLNNYRQNGHTINERYNYYEDEDEEDEEEELTIVKRVTNIFKTTINNTSRIIDSVTPNAVKRATNKCPLIFRFVVLLLFLTPCIYLLSHYISSPLPYSSFDGLVSDYAAKDAINALIKEMKTMRNDLNQLRQTNSDMNSKMKNNEFNENEKFTHLSEKMDKIEEYLNNSLKNCCRE